MTAPQASSRRPHHQKEININMQDIDPGDQVRLVDPDRYTGTKPGDIYTVTRLNCGFVEITSSGGNHLTVEPGDLRHA